MFEIGSRVTLTGTGAHEGVSCVVDSIDSEPIRYLVLARAAAVSSGTTEEGLDALSDLYDSFVTLGRPAWNLTNPKGPIPETRSGMLTVSTDLVMHLILLWTETFDAG